VAEERREVAAEEVERQEDLEDGAENGESNQVVKISQGIFSGPLPPPQVLQGYEDILPGAAERILQMAEQEQSHRHAFDNELGRSVTRQQERGQVFAFVLGAGALGLAAFMVWSGHPGYAITTTIAAIGTLAASLIYRRRAKSPAEEAGESSDQQRQDR